jgi:hypothetical protein
MISPQIKEQKAHKTDFSTRNGSTMVHLNASFFTSVGCDTVSCDSEDTKDQKKKNPRSFTSLVKEKSYASSPPANFLYYSTRL